MSDKARRVQRVEKELRQIISTYLVQSQSGSSENLVSLTNVVVSPDLRQAKAYIAILGKERVDDETLETVQSHSPEIQRLIAKQLPMKYCPRVVFYNDEGIAIMNKIDSISRGGKQ